MDQKMHDKGHKIRKAVPGEAYVGNALKHDGLRSARDVFAGIDRA